jgi:hypothetical protein
MAETTAQHRPKRQPKRDKVRMVADDVVTANSLATHLGMTRQNVALLTANAVVEQRSDGCYNQTASRLRYIKHLREHHRQTPRSAADAAHVAVKTEMLQLKLMEKRNELAKRDDHDAMIDRVAGIVLTHLGGWPARVAGTDLGLRRRAEAVLRELRTDVAKACSKAADECGEPPVDAAIE